MKKDVVVLAAVTTVSTVVAVVLLMQARLTASQSALRMLPSCLPSPPNGDEKCLFYGINLRGTNFIIVQARLGGRNAPMSRIGGRSEPISNLYRQEIPIPPNIIEVPEVAASKETTITWKDSLLGDAAGNKLLNEINVAMEKHSVDKRVFALAINSQWGNFRSSHLPITEFDTSLDAESSYPGNQIFEKLISGTYLGETVRRVLLKMAQESALFGDTVPPNLAIPYSLRSPDMAAMHQDTSEDYEIIDEKLAEIFEVGQL
ncbi:hypothetical protein RDI58_005972 [Solanum bulbocastanum]|uniref:Phosphotransferase n=1 Tax=Solanum bulbocastanum TaxID=147425 RepID=A0AAN8U0X0_SOLBU